MTLERVIEELGESDSPVRHAELARLSGLSLADVSGVMAEWMRISPGRRRELIERMIDLAFDDIAMDFTGIYRACLQDADSSVRAEAVRGLWDCEDRAVIRPLIGLLKSDPSPQVRAAAAAVLENFVDMFEDGRLLRRDGDRIGDALMDAIERDGEDLETRRRAIEAVAALRSDSVKPIIDRAYSDGDARLKRSAIYAMGRTSDASWLPTVIGDIQSDDASIRCEAAIACGRLGDESTAQYIASLLDDHDGEVQLAAVRALGMIGGDHAKRSLRQAVRKGDETMEAAAEEALASIEMDDDSAIFRFQE